jgi:hypothetical protein
VWSGVTAALGLIQLLGSAAIAQPVEVSECATFLAGREGYLSGDLTCVGTGFEAVGMGGHAELDLRGYTITSDAAGIACVGICSIVSTVAGGRIVGTGTFPRAAIDGRWGASVTVENVLLSGFYFGGIVDVPEAKLFDSTIEGMTACGLQHVGSILLVRSAVSNNPGTGIYQCGSLNATDSDISSNGSYGVDSFFGTVRLTRSTVVENGGGGLGCGGDCDLYPLNGIRSVHAVDSEISRNGGAGIDLDVASGRVSLLGTTVADNGGSGVQLVGGNVRAKESQVTGNGAAGVAIVNSGAGQICKLALASSTVTSNALHGVECASTDRARTTVRASSVTANGMDAACGVGVPCADVAASEEPRVRSDAACGTSYVTGTGLPGQSWGVCSND